MRKHASLAWLKRVSERPGSLWTINYSFRSSDGGREVFREGLFSAPSRWRAAGQCLYLMPDFARANLASFAVTRMQYDARGKLIPGMTWVYTGRA